MGKRIFIVEDNALNLKLMVDILSHIGYDLTTAEDGEEALKIIKKSDFDLMLLDIQLPKKSGYEVLKEMNKQIPTMVVSACCSDKEITQAKSLGVVDYITKPINVADFISKIKSFLG